MGGQQSQSGRLEQEKNCLSLTGFETLFVACEQVSLNLLHLI
jgi:hypothetical protein